MHKRIGWLVVCVAVLVASGPAWALTLTNTMNLGGGVLSGTNAAGGGLENIRANTLSTNLFWWADKNGDNTPGDPASAGLDMAGFNLTRVDGTAITLNLNDGVANGAVTNGGTITTSRNGVTGGVTITNAASVRLYAIDTHNQGAYGSGAIQLLSVGDVNVTSLVTGLYGGNNSNGCILVHQQGNLFVGSITNTTGTGSSYLNGPTTLIGGGPNAGICSVGSIYAVAGDANDITISNYQAVAIGAGGIDVHAQPTAWYPGSIFIRNIGLGGVTIEGNVAMTNVGGYAHSPSGLVVTAVLGPVSVLGKIDGSRVSPSSVLTPCVTISALGSVSLSAVDLSVRGPYVNGNLAAGSVSIVSATGSVTIGSISATNNLGNFAGCGGGSVSIQCARDLSLTGSVSLASAKTNETGVLALKTLGPGSRIVVPNLDCAQFRGANGTNTFDAAGGLSFVRGSVVNFATNATAGTGTPGNPLVTTQTVLRIPAGQRLYYPYAAGLTNDSLGGYAYRVANAAGTAGAGGVLMVETPGAPVIANAGVANLGTTTADLMGYLATGDAPVTVLCYWGTNSGNGVAANWLTNTPLGVCALGAVTNHLTGLTPNMTYYFQYYATNSNPLDCWAGVTSFTTLGLPGVDNGAGATNTWPATATLQGRVLSGSPAPNIWIYWGTNDAGTVKESWSQPPVALAPVGLAPFAAAVTNLTASQPYWYRCYVSNTFNNGSDAWAPSSAGFTTAPPVVLFVPASTNVVEGNAGTTTQVAFAVSLCATSAVPVVPVASALPVTLGFATRDGSATVARNDYQPVAGVISIPAGTLSASLPPVTVIGNNIAEQNKTFSMTLTNWNKAIPGVTNAVCTILNDDTVMYVRGDGVGSDTNGGTAWNDAFATLQKAFNNVAYQSGTHASASTGPIVINVQGSTGTQSYAVCGTNLGYNGYAVWALDILFQGGWMTVDTAPAQTGWSLVADPTTNHAGISITANGHYQWRRVAVNRLAFTNVTRAVELITLDGQYGFDHADVLVNISNSVIRARNDGVYLHYLKGYASTDAGGPAQIVAGNVDIIAGLAGPGDGLHIDGSWMGSRVTADGVDPSTGVPQVSTIRSLTGNGVYFSSLNNGEACDATFLNTVIYNCASNGITLDVALPGGYGGTTPYVAKATVQHCTLADNGSNGLYMLSQAAGSWASVTNSIFSGNGGHAVALNSVSNAFVCLEDYNVLFGNDLWVNGGIQAAGTNTATGDPMFFGGGTKPSPWYLLGAKASPAYKGSDGLRRGAYQMDKIAAGMLLMIR